MEIRLRLKDAYGVPGKKLRDKTVTKGFSVESIIFLNKASDGCSLRGLQSQMTGGEELSQEFRR
jgi:hypothetical protein